MIIFCSDLDNTLIYSQKQNIGQDKLCVEVMGEKVFSFMTLNSYQMLPQVRQAVYFVPVTTRTVEQYERIHFGEEVPECALVCNGGVLLVNGIRDDVWYQESLSLASKASEQMKLAELLLEQDEGRCFEIRNIEFLFLYTKSSMPEKTVLKLKQHLSGSIVDIFSIGLKIYVVPRNLSKGEAVRRLKKHRKGEFVLAAGDSEMDVSMLEAADRSIIPQSLANKVIVQKHMLVHEGSEIFSDRVLDWVWKEVLDIK